MLIFSSCSELQEHQVPRAAGVSGGACVGTAALRDVRPALQGGRRAPRRHEHDHRGWGARGAHLRHQQHHLQDLVPHDAGRLRHRIRHRHQTPWQLHRDRQLRLDFGFLRLKEEETHLKLKWKKFGFR